MDKLAEIMAAKRREIEPRLREVSEAELAAFAGRRRGAGFIESLRQPGCLSVIAEIKRRSPSAGDIKAGMNAG
ncbi:MAG: indole-3-glycerol phosphate synthase, partial [Verrucomicrobiota bacterium]